MTDFRSILKEYWGYDDFRGIQLPIIESIAQGRDTLGLMPTGGGKSLTFQVPTMAMEGLCIVITPLIALMKDQVENLRSRNIQAAAIYSGMTREDIIRTLDNAIFGGVKFLYVSPERLETELFRKKVVKMKVCLITVDESHCIAQWGHDFRPSYLNIRNLRELLPGVPVLALTATATPKTIDEIQQQLAFREPHVISMSFARPNLAYIVRDTEDKSQMLYHILTQVPGAAIVYVISRELTEELAADLRNSLHITAEAYHAGLPDEFKSARQERWKRGETRVMVATNAFGMGINKPDVRLVIHYSSPSSIEAYFQEAGRAGRDGRLAYAVLLRDGNERRQFYNSEDMSFPPIKVVREVYDNIQYFFQMAMHDGQGCIREFDIEGFYDAFYPITHNTKTNPNRYRVLGALKLLTQAGYLRYTGEISVDSQIKMRVAPQELRHYNEITRQMYDVIEIILRKYPGIVTDYMSVNEQYLSSLLPQYSIRQIGIILESLARARIILYYPKRKTHYIIYTRPRVESSSIVIPMKQYEKQIRHQRELHEAMAEYIENDAFCRSRMLLDYFGQDTDENCGICDVCIAKKKNK